jgi:hypothetical protein
MSALALLPVPQVAPDDKDLEQWAPIRDRPVGLRSTNQVEARWGMTSDPKAANVAGAAKSVNQV